MSTPGLAPAPAPAGPARVRKVEPLPRAANWHRLRKRTHVVCVLIFVALPCLDLMRLDIPNARFYFAGQELWISEFGILFFTLMFLMFLIAAVSMIHGRLFCSYACPQMIFSEFFAWAEDRIRRVARKRVVWWPLRSRDLVAQAAFSAFLLVASVFLSFVFIAYFVEPRDLLGRLARLDVVTVGGLSGALTTAFTFLDFAFVRQRFCTSVCPYGYIQGMLADDRTLLVKYDDEERQCIECKKCVRVCDMGIDIRRSPHQIECIHCGECIDACADVLGRLGQPTLIDYAWGARGSLGGAGEPWYFRLGLRDAKRVAVLLVLVFFASGLGVALATRHPVLVRVSADRSVLFTTDESGRIVNRLRLTLANRSRVDAKVTLNVVGLERAALSVGASPIALEGGESRQTALDIAVPPSALAPGVNRFDLVARVEPRGTTETFALTFIAPTAGQSP